MENVYTDDAQIPSDIFDPQPSGQGTEDAPQSIRRRVNGKDYYFDRQEHAEAFDAQMNEARRLASTHANELGMMRQHVQSLEQRIAALQTPAPASVPEPESDLAILSAPTRSIRQMIHEELQREREDINRELREAMPVIAAQTVKQTTSEQAWWEKLYQDNPHLVGKEKFIRAIMTQEYDNIKDLDLQEGQTFLVNTINEMMGGIPSSSSTTRKVLSSRQVSTERVSGASPTAQPRQQPQQGNEDLNPDWGFDILRKRKELRSRANQTMEVMTRK